MKRFGYLYEKIYDLDNLRLAHENARKGKTHYEEVQAVDADVEGHLLRLQSMLKNFEYKTSEYSMFKKFDGGKVRDIYKLPYFPDRICQWAILQVIQPILLNKLVGTSYSAIPKRGVHKACNRLKKILKEDTSIYCLKIDVKQFFPSINHDVIKRIYRKIFKDNKLLWLLDEIIDSINITNNTGIPIGNYLSQWSGNILLFEFDHWIKETKRFKNCLRYMDDVIIISDDKSKLHALLKEIKGYFKSLKLKIKKNYQIFPIESRGIDFIGYRFFKNYILVRKSIAKIMIKKLNRLGKKRVLTESDISSVCSHIGWICHVNGFNLYKKYIYNLNFKSFKS
jgi:hypothetical protein